MDVVKYSNGDVMQTLVAKYNIKHNEDRVWKYPTYSHISVSQTFGIRSLPRTLKTVQSPASLNDVVAK